MPDGRETALGIEGDAARILLPDSEPDDIGAGLGGEIEGRGHEALREAAAVPRGVDVEAPDLDRPCAGEARRRRPQSELGEGLELAFAFGDEGREAGIQDLCQLDRFAVAPANVERQVLRAVLRPESLDERALGEGRERRRIGGNSPPEGRLEGRRQDGLRDSRIARTSSPPSSGGWLSSSSRSAALPRCTVCS